MTFGSSEKSAKLYTRSIFTSLLPLLHLNSVTTFVPSFLYRPPVSNFSLKQMLSENFEGFQIRLLYLYGIYNFCGGRKRLGFYSS